MQKKLKDIILKTTGAKVIIICLIGVITWFYYYSTIAANSFWLDQYKLIEFSREILDGNFRLVGMRTSRLNWNFPMTARQVVQMGITKNSSFNPFTTKKNQNIIEECLEKVSLLSMINNQVEDMSGGERQRVFLARTLAQGAEILLLDEVFSGVDVGSQEQLIDVLRDLAIQGKTILMSTHDLNTINERFDEVLCLNRHCCAYGDPVKVLTQEVLAELYGSHTSMFRNHTLSNHGQNYGD